MKKSRCLFYAHDGYGMGHIGRVSSLAQHLKKKYSSWDVLVTTGDKNAAMMLPHNVELVKLPSFLAIPDENGKMKLTPFALSSFALTSTLRKQLLATLLENYDPDVVVVDYLARGFCRELAGIIGDYKGKKPDARFILGLRGILGTKQQAYKEVFTPLDLECIKMFYDKVFIYTDKSVIDMVSYYDLPPWFKEKMLYTGYVVSPDTEETQRTRCQASLKVPTGEKYLGVGLGSGVDAGLILRDILEALSLVSGLPEKKVVITGPKFPSELFKEFTVKYPQFLFQQFIVQYPEFVAKADFFVGLAGYNTISAWLKGANPAVLISRAQARGEQQLHLQALENLGLCIGINEIEVSVAKMVESVETIAKRTCVKHSLAMSGGEVVADYINSTVD